MKLIIKTLNFSIFSVLFCMVWKQLYCSVGILTNLFICKSYCHMDIVGLYCFHSVFLFCYTAGLVRWISPPVLIHMA